MHATASHKLRWPRSTIHILGPLACLWALVLLCFSRLVEEPDVEQEPKNLHIFLPQIEHGDLSPAVAGRSPPRPPGSRAPLEPGELVVVVMAHSRHDCLRKVLDALVTQRDASRFAHAISMDDSSHFNTMYAVARRYLSRLPMDIWHMPKAEMPQNHDLEAIDRKMIKIAEHFRFALTEAFAVRQFPFAIFLEEDLRPSPDFLWYFRATGWLLEQDPSLFCVSAWNDNGYRWLASDEYNLMRTDFFPGLGWMVTNQSGLAMTSVWPSVPKAGWDHWVRCCAPVAGRECVMPEVPRTHHFSTRGTTVDKSSAQALDNMVESTLPAGGLGDVAGLLAGPYEEALRAALRGVPVAALEDLEGLGAGEARILPYIVEEYSRIAKVLRIFPSQPRTEHRGLLVTRHPSSRAKIYLIDRRRGGAYLPAEERWSPDPRRSVQSADAGESCDEHCRRLGLRCDARQLLWVNSCDAMLRHFPCEARCGHGRGRDVPSYVHNPRKAEGLQCLVSTESWSMPDCQAANRDRTRLCVCIP